MIGVSEAVARPARTGVQMGLGAVLVEFADAFGLGLDDRQYAVSVVLAGLVVGFLQVVAENRYGAGLLRRVMPTRVPAVDKPAGDAGLTLLEALVVGLVVVVVLILLGVLR